MKLQDGDGQKRFYTFFIYVCPFPEFNRFDDSVLAQLALAFKRTAWKLTSMQRLHTTSNVTVGTYVDQERFGVLMCGALFGVHHLYESCC